MKFSIEIDAAKFKYSYEVYSSRQSGEGVMGVELYLLFAECLKKLTECQRRDHEERRQAAFEFAILNKKKEAPDE